MSQKRNTRLQVMSDIETIADRLGVSVSVVCNRSMGDARLYQRLQKGGSMTIYKMDMLYEWIEQEEKNL